ncbi:hypothetical protein CF392_00460 [Tamilnaduibacter salinus]|uniref:Acyl-homoserine-lactone acylase n=1 Tax=Tamilnaduibacter salinus TaxID=1484056 RepID=A0A2A2I755_9GAMM|nr:penicillin acylase family protein [Tamilnaduibacter salinus]PAV27422.1 hypothetical protein CF392_00460 [Tamilnaduibacter salinus]
MRRATWLPIAALSLGVIAGCNDDNDNNPSTGNTAATSYEADITRTTHGTAHVRAENYGSLGYGQGYAFAEDRFCTLMDQIVKVRSERAKYLGPGENNANIASDVAYKALNVMERASNNLPELNKNTREMITGYAAGFNAYLEKTGAANLPGDCAGADWVSPITSQDLVAYYLDLATLAGSRNFLPAFANAKPPQANATGLALDNVNVRIPQDYASNGIALGKEMTAGEGGALLSNTHLPWEGEAIYHEVHLTIPGELDVAGASLSGGIGVQLGFNQNMAWTHTTSPSKQFILYRLDLAEDDPTAYVVDGEKRSMTTRDISIDVKGMEQPFTQTLYSSDFGPILAAPSQGLGWDSDQAFAIYDVNIDNAEFLGTFLEMAKAQSVRELRQVFLDRGGVPWNHTMATDSNGESFYADTTFVPFLLPQVESQLLQALQSDPQLQQLFDAGLLLLDGKTDLAKPIVVPGFPVAGAIPFDRAPYTFRDDYVMNSNDSYWLPNADERLEASTRLYGDPGTKPRSFRTRMGLTMLEGSNEFGSALITPGQATKESLQDLLFSNWSFTGLLWRDQICDGSETGDLGAACNTIETTWDGKLNLDSRGVALFREALSPIKDLLTDDGELIQLDGNGDPQRNPDGSLVTEAMFTTAYDPADPVNTPSGLTNVGSQTLQNSLAQAAQKLGNASLPLDAPLKTLQFTRKGDETIPIHGGLQKIDGAYNKVEYRDDDNLFTSTLPALDRKPVLNEPSNLTEEGYLINYGASYVMTVEYTEEGPSAEALLTYSQSNNADGRGFFKDQTELYSKKTWRSVPFTAEAIAREAVEEKTVSSP